MSEPLLSLEIIIDGDTLYLLYLLDNAVYHLVIDPQTRIQRESSELHGLAAVKAPAGAARCMNLNIAGTFDA